MTPAPERLLETWNRALGADFPLRLELARQFLSVDVVPEASASEPEGLVVTKRDGAVGWVAALVVEPSARGRGAGGRLLDHAVRGLWRAGAREIRLGGDRLHLLPGVPEPGPAGFFRARGFELGDPVVDLRRDLEGWRPPPHLPVVAPAPDWEPVLAFLGADFPDRWLWEAKEARRRGAEAGAYLLLDAGGSVGGFAEVWGPEPPVGLAPPSAHWRPLLGGRAGGLGPIGVAESLRGRGLGLGLLLAAMGHLRARGVRDMVIDWTGLVEFYARAGFRPWKRYLPGLLR